MSSLAVDTEPRRQRPGASLTAEGLLRRRAAQFPDVPALADPSRALSYREADGCVDALAGFLIELGLAPGDRIAVELPNTVETPLMLLAAWRAV